MFQSGFNLGLELGLCLDLSIGCGSGLRLEIISLGLTRGGRLGSGLCIGITTVRGSVRGGSCGCEINLAAPSVRLACRGDACSGLFLDLRRLGFASAFDGDRNASRDLGFTLITLGLGLDVSLITLGPVLGSGCDSFGPGRRVPTSTTFETGFLTTRLLMVRRDVARPFS